MYLKLILLRLVAVLSSASLPFIFLEIYSRFLPSVDYFQIQKPVLCEKSDFNFNLTETCFHRHKPNHNFNYSIGKYPWSVHHAVKTTNDVGQFSSTSFRDLISLKHVQDVLVFGDSYIEAKQVDNDLTYSGILNNSGYFTYSMGASGMALPNYSMSFQYLNSIRDTSDSVIIFNVVANDFDESFLNILLLQGELVGDSSSIQLKGELNFTMERR